MNPQAVAATISRLKQVASLVNNSEIPSAGTTVRMTARVTYSALHTERVGFTFIQRVKDAQF